MVRDVFDVRRRRTVVLRRQALASEVRGGIGPETCGPQAVEGFAVDSGLLRIWHIWGSGDRHVEASEPPGRRLLSCGGILVGCWGPWGGRAWREVGCGVLSARWDARAFAISRDFRDACLCLTIGIIVSCGARELSPVCRWRRVIKPQVVG